MFVAPRARRQETVPPFAHHARRREVHISSIDFCRFPSGCAIRHQGRQLVQRHAARHKRRSALLNSNPLDLIERNFFLAPVVKLRRPRRLVVGDVLRDFELSALLHCFAVPALVIGIHRKRVELLPKRAAAFWEEPGKQKTRRCRAQELSRSTAQWRGKEREVYTAIRRENSVVKSHPPISLSTQRLPSRCCFSSLLVADLAGALFFFGPYGIHSRDERGPECRASGIRRYERSRLCRRVAREAGR